MTKDYDRGMEMLAITIVAAVIAYSALAFWYFW